ncbi:MAG: hypothetical protein ACFHWX_20505 [Bacteroidota bacterium]
MRFIVAILFVSLIAYSCKRTSNQADDGSTIEVVTFNNPPADGFNIEGSNPTAIMLADQTMNSMGGREAWDNTKYVSWNFFGRRQLLWDRVENRVRIDRDNMVMSLNMEDMTGKVWRDGEELQDSDTVNKFLKSAKDIWINDSYWLFMPFKLKDSGVTLSYLRDDTTKAGDPSIVLRLTFEGVGNTPQNAYEVWINDETRLVRQWAYYKNANDEEPSFVLPWDNYQKYGEVLLSGDRGDRKITDIKVWDKLPKNAFSSPDPIYKPNS